jgi:hypothetical protein
MRTFAAILLAASPRELAAQRCAGTICRSTWHGETHGCYRLSPVNLESERI